MAFHDILQALAADADSRVAAARKRQAESLAAARDAFELATADRLAGIRAECERKKKNMERQVTAHAHMSGRQAVMATKHRLMEKAYAAALEKLSTLDAARTEELLKRLLDRCPAGGTIRPAEPHAAIVKKLAAGRDVGESVKAAGGFVHVSDSAERDCTYETLVHDILRPATELNVASTLFPGHGA
jgi:vacuolar-type H+-ATPase subunit E/Vma4